jgi:hypothetical protein
MTDKATLERSSVLIRERYVLPGMPCPTRTQS